jgi:shikimate dehydrogenase
LPDVQCERVVLVGAGGAGAAVAHALLKLNAGQLIIVDADAGRAVALAHALCRRFGDGRAVAACDVTEVLAGADGLVNASPVGMAKFPGLPVPPNLLRPELWVADVVYFPLRTALLEAAGARGCRIMSGAGMAAFQAAGAFELFTGLPADTGRMLAHFAELTGGGSFT